MSEVTQEDWLQWVNHPVTVEIQKAVRERIQESKDQLADPNSDADRDRFLKGMIWAFGEVLDAKPEISIEEKLFDDV